jgi:hypothetical protein
LSLITISAAGGATEHWTEIEVAPECRTALVIASWAIRSSSLSISGRSRVVFSSRVTWMGMPLLALRWRANEPMAVPSESFSPISVRRVCTDRRTSPTTIVSRSRNIVSWRARVESAGSWSTRVSTK